MVPAAIYIPEPDFKKNRIGTPCLILSFHRVCGNVLLPGRQWYPMASARCCPADCALRDDWENELAQEKASLSQPQVAELDRLMKLLAHPLRLRIILMLLNRDHCVCEFYYVFAEPQNLISYNLKKLRDGGLIASYYRSNHRIYRLDEAMVPVLRNLTVSVTA